VDESGTAGARPDGMTHFARLYRLRSLLALATLALLGCGSGAGETKPDAGATEGGSKDATPPTDARSTDSASPMDAPTESSPTGDAKSGTGACPLSGDPVACDDGTGSLGTGKRCPLSTVMGATSSYHLTVSGSKFATIGVCAYVMPSSCTNTAGDVLEFSGGEGTVPAHTLDGLANESPYCFRLVSVVWDSNWADNGLTTGGPAGMGGDVLGASQRPEAVIEWERSYLRASTSTPVCATGGSAGSSLLLYQIMHNNGAELLDHVQVTEATPYARFDQGCDPNAGAEGTAVVCSGLPADTDPQYSFLSGSSTPQTGPVTLVRGDTHDPNCDTEGGSLSSSERAALQAMSLVTSGFAPITLKQTSLSVYMCATVPNATQGEAVYVFGTDADLASAGTGPYTGLISLDLATSFYSCKANSTCTPHIVCDPLCATEEFGKAPDAGAELAEDMKANCILRH
jgi:hypothetical protein